MMKHLPCLFPCFLSVCSPPFLSLSFFSHSPFLLFSALTPSCLLPFSPSLFPFSAEAHLPQLPWICAFYSHSHCYPQCEPIYLLYLPPRIREFFLPRPSTGLHPSLFTHTPDRKSTRTNPLTLTLTLTCTPVNRTVVRFCL